MNHTRFEHTCQNFADDTVRHSLSLSKNLVEIFGNMQKAAGSVGVMGETLQMPWRPQRQSVAADANARGSLQP